MNTLFSSPFNSLVQWLADYQLLALALLAVALLTLWRLKQPAQRLAVVRPALAALALLALLCALPGWSVVHLFQADAKRQAAAAPHAPLAASPREVPTTEFLLTDNANHIPTSIATPPTIALPEQSRVETKPEPAAAAAAPGLAAYVAIDAVCVYLVGSTLVLLWLAAGIVAAARLRRNATPAPESLTNLLRARRSSRAKLPQLLLSDEIETPVALGIRRPAILLPNQLVEETSPANLLAILAHELAHIEHGDLKLLAASRWLLVLLWPQPLYWLVRRNLRLDQETLADAAAAEATDRHEYAEQLVSLARSTQFKNGSAAGAPRLAGAVGLWETRSQLKRRIATLLDDRLTILRDCTARWRWACAAAIAVAAIGLSLVTLEPARVAVAEEETAKSTETIPDAEEEPTVKAPELEEEKPEAEIKQPAAGKAEKKPTEKTVPQPAQPNDAAALVATPDESTADANKLTLICRDKSGKPVAGAKATLYRVAMRSGAQEKIAAKETNDHGAVEFSDFIPADVIAEWKRRRTENDFPAAMDKNYAIVVQHPGLASRIVTAMEHSLAMQGVRREVTLPPAATLSGQVVDPNGKPVAGAVVTVGSLASFLSIEGVNAAQTDEQGRYVFDHLHKFDMAAAAQNQESDTVFYIDVADPPTPRADDNKPDPLTSAITVRHPDFAFTQQIAGDIPGTFDLVLHPGGEIAGRVVQLDGGKPADNVSVRIISSSTPGVDGLTGARRELARRLPRYNAVERTDARGRYRFTNLPPGSYTVVPQASSTDIRQAEWIGHSESGVKAQPGQTTAAPDLKIGRGGTLRGQLIDAVTGKPPVFGQQAIDTTVIYMLADPLSTQSISARHFQVSDAGQFQIPAPPGKFRVAAYIKEASKPGSTPSYAPTLYRSADDSGKTGPALEVPAGKTLAANIKVFSKASIAEIHQFLGKAYNSKGQAAVDAFTHALELDPNNANALANRMIAYAEVADFKAIEADSTKLIELGAQPYYALAAVAETLATTADPKQRNGVLAVKYAKQALEYARKAGNPDTNQFYQLLVLAAAYAEAGDFQRAVKTQQKVLQLYPDNADMQTRLKLYQAGKPYHLPAPKP